MDALSGAGGDLLGFGWHFGDFYSCGQDNRGRKNAEF